MNICKNVVKLAAASAVAISFNACSSDTAATIPVVAQTPAAETPAAQEPAATDLNTPICNANNICCVPATGACFNSLTSELCNSDGSPLTPAANTPVANDPAANTPVANDPVVNDPTAVSSSSVAAPVVSSSSVAATPVVKSSSSKATAAAADDGAFALELWDGAEGKAQVQTGNAKGGWWYSYTDVDNKGESTLTWGAEVGDEYDDASMAPVVKACEGICGDYELKVGGNQYKPFVGFAFGYGAKATETGDGTAMKGICIEYSSDNNIKIELGLTPTQETKIGYANPFAEVDAASSLTVVDLAWADFAQPTWVSATQKITTTAAVKELSSIKFKLEGPTDGEDGGSGSFKITKVGPKGSCK